MTEAEAIAAGFRCACRYLRLSDVPRAITNHNTRGGIKIVADADAGKVLGIHALAETSGEMMLAAIYAIKAGFTVTQLADTWAPYLTMAEGIRLIANHFRNEPPHLLLRLATEGQPNGPESSRETGIGTTASIRAECPPRGRIA